MAFTPTNTNYANSGIIGTDFSTVSTYATLGEDPPFELGQTAMGNDGTCWCFVLAGATIAQYDCVAIDEDFTASPVTKALADAGHSIGFAQVAFASGEYGWVATSGKDIGCNVLTLYAADAPMYTTATAGKLDDLATAQTLIEGVRGVTTAGGSTEPVEVIANNPHIALAG